MNCIIVDDDILSCKIFEGFVKNFSSLNLIGIFTDSSEARKILSERSDIDLIILDIEMPKMSGFELIKSLENPPRIIIVSSFEEYAITAFDYNVVDYLIKPVSYGRFCKAMDKTIRYFAQKEVPVTTVDEIFIKEGSSLVKMKLSELIFIEALENYILLNTKDARYTIHFTMKAIESQLPSDIFLRVHRSYIVNKRMILAINEDSLELNIGNSKKNIPIGKSYRNSLLQDINTMVK